MRGIIQTLQLNIAITKQSFVAIALFLTCGIASSAPSRSAKEIGTMANPAVISGTDIDKSSEYYREWPQGRPALFRLSNNMTFAIPPQYMRFWIQKDRVDCSRGERYADLTNPLFTRGLRWSWERHQQPIAYEIPIHDVVWTLGTASAVHHRAFDDDLLLRERSAPSLRIDSLITAARSLGVRVKRHSTKCELRPSRRLPAETLQRWNCGLAKRENLSEAKCDCQ
jgi:hypothetical protein